MYNGACFCGAVTIEADGETLAMECCHGLPKFKDFPAEDGGSGELILRDG